MLFSGDSNAKINIMVEKQKVSNSACEKLLGVFLDIICKNVALNLNAISKCYSIWISSKSN